MTRPPTRDDAPLKDEAKSRSEWRGDDREAPRPEAGDHEAPASEAESAIGRPDRRPPDVAAPPD